MGKGVNLYRFSNHGVLGGGSKNSDGSERERAAEGSKNGKKETGLKKKNLIGGRRKVTLGG